MARIFEIADARSLFNEAQSAFIEYCKTPSERLFLFLVFALNHLREWIAECDYDKINKKKEAGIVLTKEESFFCQIWLLEEFRTINDFCNLGKHYKTKNREHETGKLHRFRCGFSRCGTDSLNQEYFLIDGKDSRDFLRPVYLAYLEWFEENS